MRAVTDSSRPPRGRSPTARSRPPSTAPPARRSASAKRRWPSSRNSPRRGSAGTRIKDHVVTHLDHYLEEFERNAVASGAKVHWAATAEEACLIVLGICRAAGARSVTRAKSMLGEEIGLPHALEAAGISRSRPTWPSTSSSSPASRPRTSSGRRCTRPASRSPRCSTPPPRSRTRPTMWRPWSRARGASCASRFLTADVGISGANFLVADSGAVCTVTNEGNAELTTTPPRVHVVTAGIEKLVPSLRTPSRCCGCWCARRPAPTHAVHHLPLRPEAGRATRTGRRRSTSSWWTTAAAACCARGCATCCAASAAGPA